MPLNYLIVTVSNDVYVSVLENIVNSVVLILRKQSRLIAFCLSMAMNALLYDKKMRRLESENMHRINRFFAVCIIRFRVGFRISGKGGSYV